MGFALSEINLRSTAFSPQGRIPKDHTGEGEDYSPQLSWSSVPDNTESFAVVCHDPDAPLITPLGYGFVHWVLYGIPRPVHELPEDCEEYVHGRNDFGNIGYGGPMPPPGHGTHHYYFWIIALDSMISLPAGLRLPELFTEIEPAVIGMNRLIGTYSRN